MHNSRQSGFHTADTFSYIHKVHTLFIYRIYKYIDISRIHIHNICTWSGSRRGQHGAQLFQTYTLSCLLSVQYRSIARRPSLGPSIMLVCVRCCRCVVVNERSSMQMVQHNAYTCGKNDGSTGARLRLRIACENKYVACCACVRSIYSATTNRPFVRRRRCFRFTQKLSRSSLLGCPFPTKPAHHSRSPIIQSTRSQCRCRHTQCTEPQRRFRRAG